MDKSHNNFISGKLFQKRPNGKPGGKSTLSTLFRPFDLNAPSFQTFDCISLTFYARKIRFPTDNPIKDLRGHLDNMRNFLNNFITPTPPCVTR